MESVDGSRRGHLWPLQRLTIAVLVVFVAAAIGLYVGATKLVGDQEHRLLKERTAEVAELLSGSIGVSLTSSLAPLAAAAQESPAAFLQEAQDAAASSTVAATALVAKQGGTWTVQAAVGQALQTGQTLDDARLALVSSADGQIHTDLFTLPGNQSRLGITLGPPVAPAGSVIYEEIVADPTRPATITQSEPFHELNAAVYVGSKPVSSDLLLATTSKLPLTGDVVSSPVKVGASTWLVRAEAREPLAGSFAHAMPLALGAAVLLIGLAMTALVEAVARRRNYAMALVAERTAELEDSLGELERAQQAVVANERLAALGQMAATVGHELRNPLSVLTNSLYLIRNAVSGVTDDRLGRQLDTADREVAAATLIVSDLLEFSRPRTANPTELDIPGLLEEAVSVAPPPSAIQVVRQDGEAPPVFADRDQIRQVVLNLLTNAYEAMPEGGTVTVGAHVGTDAVDISVADTGVGMDSATQARVFEPFFSLKTKGTGLGLAVSKRIVEAHAGTLTVDSRPGQGTTVIISLPLASVAAEAGAR